MIGIIDYGAGNLTSLTNTLARMGVLYTVSADPKILETCEKIIFPGVGHAKSAMESLQKNRLDIFLSTTTKPLLGICLGMQLLFEFSEEGYTKAIGRIKGAVKKFLSEEVGIIPHTGWNTCRDAMNRVSTADMYFVHSYYCVPKDDTSVWMTTEYNGKTFCSAIQQGNVWGMQFHPEKSGKRGEEFLQSFIDL
ncbi:MAG: imidazole glycerol phosphate synthase subunit HisH [Candidatus Peregrinibacteria bacterium]